MSETSNSSFYSDDVFFAHPEANRFEMMNQTEIEELGRSIAEGRQIEAIELYDGKILDGRNRYLACKTFNITPLFTHLPKNTDPKKHNIDRNLIRRHLPTAQKADVALEELEEEVEKAKERKLSQLIQNKKNTDGVSEVRSVTKGKAIEIVAKKFSVSKNSVVIAMKVRDLNDPAIKELWAQARKGKATVKSVQELIRKKFPKKPRIKKDSTISINESPTLSSQTPIDKLLKVKGKEKILCSPSKNLNLKNKKEKKLKNATNNYNLRLFAINEIEEDLIIEKFIKKHKITPKTLIKDEKIEKSSLEDLNIQEKRIEKKIKKGIVNKFKEMGQNISKKNTSLEIQKKEKEKQNSVGRNENGFDKCLYCTKATVFAITCEKCGHPTSRVLCDDDFISRNKRLVNPNLKKCPNSPNQTPLDYN